MRLLRFLPSLLATLPAVTAAPNPDSLVTWDRYSLSGPAVPSRPNDCARG